MELKLNKKKVIAWIKKNKAKIILGISSGILAPSLVFILIKYLKTPEKVSIQDQKTIQGLITSQNVHKPEIKTVTASTNIPILSKTLDAAISPKIDEHIMTNPEILFTTKQKKIIVKMLKSKKNYEKYISDITGRPYISKVKLYKKDPIPVYLHVIQGNALGHSAEDILQGAEILRKLSKTVTMPYLNN